MIQPTVINLHPNECSQVLHLDRCLRSCNSYRVCAPDKREDLNLYVFNMIPGINET